MNNISEEFKEVGYENKEDDTIKGKLNRNRNDDKKKKIILYVGAGILLAGILFVTLLTFLGKDNNRLNDKDNDAPKDEVVNGEIQDTEENSEIYYVSCDDNTALLNVRNSTTGVIIDGLSCYKEVIVEEELEGTDNCSKWYKISYNKNGSNYTGYACAAYIKKSNTTKNNITTVRNFVDKANDYYENSVLKAYCGKTKATKIIKFDDNMEGEYVKSEYKSIEELKNYLLSFLDEDLIKIKLELSDINSPKYYDNYYEIEGDLYCRNYAGKGWITNYTGNYDIEVTSYTDNKITANIAYEYVDQNSDCNLNELSKCSRSDFVYQIGKITINNGIITNMDFHS